MLDLTWVHKELAPYYSHTGRPSIDPVLTIRMPLVGYVFAIRSERRICAEIQVNLAYRWFCNRRQDSRSLGILPCAARALPRERCPTPGIRGRSGNVHCGRAIRVSHRPVRLVLIKRSDRSSTAHSNSRTVRALNPGHAVAPHVAFLGGLSRVGAAGFSADSRRSHWGKAASEGGLLCGMSNLY